MCRLAVDRGHLRTSQALHWVGCFLSTAGCWHMHRHYSGAYVPSVCASESCRAPRMCARGRAPPRGFHVAEVCDVICGAAPPPPPPPLRAPASPFPTSALPAVGACHVDGLQAWRGGPRRVRPSCFFRVASLLAAAGIVAMLAAVLPPGVQADDSTAPSRSRTTSMSPTPTTSLSRRPSPAASPFVATVTGLNPDGTGYGR